MRGRRHCVAHTVAWQGSARAGATRSAEDRRLRARVLQEEPSCRDCGAPSTVAGHIVPFAYGGPYTRENLKGQCVKCNTEQIQTDRLRFGP